MDINAQLGDAYINTAKQRGGSRSINSISINSNASERIAAGDKGEFDTISKAFVQQHHNIL